jgi:hypothetical protein
VNISILRKKRFVKKLDVIAQNQNHFRNQGVEIVQKLSILCNIEISAGLCNLSCTPAKIREIAKNTVANLLPDKS